MKGNGKSNACRHDPDRQSGFTLVELLVSLMIVTLILSFIPGTLRIGKRVWETDEAFEQRAALSSFRRYVEQRLSEAIPLYSRDRSGALHLEFAGEPGKMTFLAPAPAGPAGGGVYRFELRQEENGQQGGPLILTQTLYRQRQTSKADNEGERSPLTIEHRTDASVTGLAFRYFGTPEPQKPSRWLSHWPRTDSLPELVEMSSMSGGPSPKVEKIIVPLQLRR